MRWGRPVSIRNYYSTEGVATTCKPEGGRAAGRPVVLTIRATVPVPTTPGPHSLAGTHPAVGAEAVCRH